MADIFDVIADATRRDILQILLDRYESDSAVTHGGTSVSEIVTALGLSQPTVSKHLKVLRETGLVTVRPAAQKRYYAINKPALADVAAWLSSMAGLERRP